MPVPTEEGDVIVPTSGETLFTVIVEVSESSSPWLSVTVKLAVYSPLSAYV
jgi:hypothetical protein